MCVAAKEVKGKLESAKSAESAKQKNKIKREERDEWEFATLPFCQSKFLKVSKYQSFTTKIQKERHSDTEKIQKR